MAQGKKGFILYADQIEVFKLLNNEQAGQLIKHVLAYVNDENPTLTNPLLEMAFVPIKQQLKRDLDKWEKRAERSKQNGKLGGRPPKPKKPSGLIENPEKPKKPVNVNVNVTDNVNVNVNGNVIDNNTYVEIQRIYNEVCLSLPKIKKLSDARKKAIKRFLKDNSLTDLGDLFKKVEASEFLTGKNDRNWTADFDWILKPSNALKIQEGRYDTKQAQNGKETRSEYVKRVLDAVEQGTQQAINNNI